jgi:rhomboid protease GluP
LLLEILYLSVVVVTGFQAYILLRRAGPLQRPYAGMLVVDGILCLFGFLSRRGFIPAEADLLGVIGLGAFICLVMLPPLLRDLSRRAVAGERFRLALRLLDVRELLQPGLGARQERELVAAIADVRAGNVDRALSALRARRDRVDDPVRRTALDDRITLTLLYARRWGEAVAQYERSRPPAGTPIPTPIQLLVEVVRAYGELGDLEKAASLLALLEGSSAAKEPTLVFLVARARMVFLAFAGQSQPVATLLAPASPLALLPPSARLYWLGTAQLLAGEREDARRSLTEALRAAGRDPRARQAAEERLILVDDPTLILPRELSPEVTGLAARVAQLSLDTPAAPPRLDGVGARAVPVTLAFIAANALVFAVVSLLLGSTEDPIPLVRAGANLKQAVRAGEWWRLHASTFLHVGFLHLAVNMLGLWSLGKLVEQIFGSLRFFVLYALTGLAGAVASLIFGGDGISAGASGAVFGVLGAAILELARAGKGSGQSDRWRRALLGNLMFIAIAQLAIGALYPMIDQAAHVGGLVAGGVLAFFLSPRRAPGRLKAMRYVAWLLAAASLASFGWSAVAAKRTTFVETVDRIGWSRRVLGDVSVDLPVLWKTEGDAADDPTSMLSLDVQARQTGRALIARELEDDEKELRARFSDAGPVSASIPLAGWEVHELRFTWSEEDIHTPLRRVIYVREEGERAILVTFMIPDDQLVLRRPLVERIVGSATLSAR